MQQLFYTSCPDDRGFSKERGFGVWAASCKKPGDIPEPVLRATPYPSALVRSFQKPPIRWVCGKAADGSRFLVRAVYVGAAQGGREGNYFSHALFAIPVDISCRQLLTTTTADFWQEAWTGGPVLPEIAELPAGSLAPEAEITESLNQEPEFRNLTAVVVAAWLDNWVMGASRRRLQVPAGDNLLSLVSTLIRIVPEKALEELTFSTLEERDDGRFCVVALPAATLKHLNSNSTSILNLVNAEGVRGRLSHAARRYAEWAVGQAANNNWSLLQEALRITKVHSVSNVDVLATIPRLLDSPTKIEFSDWKMLCADSETRKLVIGIPRAFQALLEIATGPELDIELLSNLNPSIDEPNRNPVRTALSNCIFSSAVNGDSTQLNPLLTLLRDYSGSAQEFGKLLYSLLSRIETHRLEHKSLPVFAIRLRLLQEMPGWLKTLNDHQAREDWLKSSYSDDCLRFLPSSDDRDKRTVIASDHNLQVAALAAYLRNAREPLATDSGLAVWLRDQPVLLADSLLLVNGPAASIVDEVLKHRDFQIVEFVLSHETVATQGQPNSSAFSLARERYAAAALTFSARTGKENDVRRIHPHTDENILTLIHRELGRELGKGDQTNTNVIFNLAAIAYTFDPCHLQAFVRGTSDWSHFSPSGCIKLFELLYKQPDESDPEFRNLLGRFPAAALTELCGHANPRLRQLAIAACFETQASLKFSNWMARDYLHALECFSSAPVRKTNHHQMFEQVRKSWPADLLLSRDVLSTLQDDAMSQQCLHPILDEALLQAAVALPLPNQDVLKSLCEVAIWLSQNAPDTQQGIAKFGNRLFEEELAGASLPDGWRNLRACLSKIPDCELKTRLGLRQFLTLAAKPSETDICALAASLANSSDDYQQSFRFKLKSLYPANRDKFQQFLFENAAHDLQNGVSFIGKRFDAIFCLFNDASGYYHVIKDLSNGAQRQLFGDVRSVAVSLFPFVRYRDKVDVGAFPMIAKIVLQAWFQEHPLADRQTEEEYRKQRLAEIFECLADLKPQQRDCFRILCVNEMKHFAVPKPPSGNWSILSAAKKLITGGDGNR